MSVCQTAILEKIYISPGHDFKGRFGKERLRHEIVSVNSIRCVAGRGIEGDRYLDYKKDWKGQISFIDRKVIDEVMASLGMSELDDSVFRRNVVVSGIDLNDLIGKSFRIGGASFLGTEECSPCFWMDQAVGEGAHELLKGRGGLRCKILESGELSLGEVEIDIHPAM